MWAMVTAYQIAKILGRDPSLLYKIQRGERRASPSLAMAIDSLKITGWRFQDLRPDLVEMVEKVASQE